MSSLRNVIAGELRRCPNMPVHERRRLERRLADAIEGAGYRQDRDPFEDLDPGLKRAATSAAEIGVRFALMGRGLSKALDDLVQRWGRPTYGSSVREGLRTVQQEARRG